MVSVSFNGDKLSASMFAFAGLYRILKTKLAKDEIHQCPVASTCSFTVLKT